MGVTCEMNIVCLVARVDLVCQTNEPQGNTCSRMLYTESLDIIYVLEL